MALTYEPIATNTVSGTSTTTITFSSIPSTYTDLILVSQNSTSADVNIGIQFNADAGANYSATLLYGDGTTATSTRNSNLSYARPEAGNPTNFGNWTFQIMNYANTTTNKTTISRWSRAGQIVGAVVSLWRSTAAITEVKVFISSGYFIAGSTFTLYGIKAA